VVPSKAKKPYYLYGKGDVLEVIEKKERGVNRDRDLRYPWPHPLRNRTNKRGLGVKTAVGEKGFTGGGRMGSLPPVIGLIEKALEDYLRGELATWEKDFGIGNLN